MSDASAETLLACMRHAVLAAARATRFVQAAYRDAHGDGIKALAKEDRSPVTAADWASQAVVSLLLSGDAEAERLPLVGEESAAPLRGATLPEGRELLARVTAAVSHALGPTSERACLDAIERGTGEPGPSFLTLDPVDGTKGFLRGQQYAISLALIRDGEVTAGVVACPNLPLHERYDEPDEVGCVAHALRGGGAFMARGDEGPAALRIAAWRPGAPVRACESVESSHSRHDLAATLVAQIGAAGAPARLDSQAKYLVVARGGADVYLRLPTRAGYREKIWDHAAGALVASEAGARVCDLAGRPLDFSQGRELANNRGVLAGHPEVVARLVDTIALRGAEPR